MQYIRFALSLCLLASVGCGKTTPEAYIHEPLTTDSSSPWAGQFDSQTGDIQFRAQEGAAEQLALARYPHTSSALRGMSTCLVDVAPESEGTVRSDILAALNRNWRKVFEPKRGISEFEIPSNRDFRFDLTSQVAIVGPGSFFTRQESIQYKRLCLSRELIRSDAYRGMRILELEAMNNEGVVYFAFRFKKRNDDPRKNLLLMTAHKYNRYGQIARNLDSVEHVFAPIANGSLGIPVGVYIEN